MNAVTPPKLSVSVSRSAVNGSSGSGVPFLPDNGKRISIRCIESPIRKAEGHIAGGYGLSPFLVSAITFALLDHCFCFRASVGRERLSYIVALFKLSLLSADKSLIDLMWLD